MLTMRITFVFTNLNRIAYSSGWQPGFTRGWTTIYTPQHFEKSMPPPKDFSYYNITPFTSPGGSLLPPLPLRRKKAKSIEIRISLDALTLLYLCIHL